MALSSVFRVYLCTERHVLFDYLNTESDTPTYGYFVLQTCHFRKHLMSPDEPSWASKIFLVKSLFCCSNISFSQTCRYRPKEIRNGTVLRCWCLSVMQVIQTLAWESQRFWDLAAWTFGQTHFLLCHAVVQWTVVANILQERRSAAMPMRKVWNPNSSSLCTLPPQQLHINSFLIEN